MFKIARVGEPGWLNTPVTVVAIMKMAVHETRLKYHNLHVAKVEEWLLEIGEGERFEIALRNGVKPSVGDTIELDAIIRDRPLRSNWTKRSTF